MLLKTDTECLIIVPKEVDYGARCVTKTTHVRFVLVGLVDALCDVADRCIDDTVAELSLAGDMLRDVILAFIVNKHFIDIHLDDIALHQPIQGLVDVLDPETPDKVVSAAVRD